MEKEVNLLTLKEASEWASNYLGRHVNPSNILYLIQYAKIRKCMSNFKEIRVELSDLQDYYDRNIIKKQEEWKKKLGSDLDWGLSFDQLGESERTKHVHRLHPYKGKFIPQLVEYFLDTHTDSLKKEVFFEEGNTVLDPFMGSGTTLIQSLELGINSIGIDVSEFNCLMSNVKIRDYDIHEVDRVLKDALFKARYFSITAFNDSFDVELKNRILEFNKIYFPNPEIKHKFRSGEIKEEKYGDLKINQFIKENKDFLEENGTKDSDLLFNEKEMKPFLAKWFSKRMKQELFYYINLISEIKDKKLQSLMRIILSRAARSCRATTHSDLATLKKPQSGPYYCRKHKKICAPVNSVLKHLSTNTYDTIRRLQEFSKLKKGSYSNVIHGDSREVDIFSEIKKQNPEFYNLLTKGKIDGVFTSPPYVGQIDYHEQHAYAYELFDIEREDEKEIGPLYKGQGEQAKREYVNGISKVLTNMKKFLKDDCNVFIVANDKFNLYPTIAIASGFKIVNQFKRPVLNRTEKDRSPYAETIFLMKKF